MAKRIGMEVAIAAVEAVALCNIDVAAVYPITPQSHIAEHMADVIHDGRIDSEFITVESEHSAISACAGASAAGARVYTATSSQGLMLMLPNMHKIAGEMLPTLFLVSARALACQSLSIFGDHSDVMSARNTGFAMTCAGSVQEAQDLAIAAYLASLRTRIPFLHFFDGFRTSNVVEKVDLVSSDTLKELFEPQYLEDFRRRSLNPERPIQKVGQQNPDVYFQGRETVNPYYKAAPGIVQEAMDKFAKITERQYHLFDYIGHPQAERVVIIMGSGGETAGATVNALAAKGEKMLARKGSSYSIIDAKEGQNLSKKLNTTSFEAVIDPPADRRVKVV